jgi:hypothetical protein
MIANPTPVAQPTPAAPASATPARPRQSTRQLSGQRRLSTARFDLAITLASAWFVGGLYLDGWAHNTIPSLETFFTPWHGVLYSGFFACVAVLGWAIGRNRAAGLSWWPAIPGGYELSAIGALVFVAAGLGDMLWHIAFGIEANVDALLSPTHLLLLFGGTLFISGPIRASQRRLISGIRDQGTLAQLPRVLSLTFLLLSAAFFTQYANPWGGPWAISANRPVMELVPTAGGQGIDTTFLLQALTVAGVLVQAALLAGVASVALRQGPLPAGSFSLMIGLYVALTVLMRQKYDAGFQPQLIVAGLLAGAALDTLQIWLRQAFHEPEVYQLSAVLVPAIVTAACVGALALSQGLWWSIHLWSGAVVLAGATGWLVSLLAPVASPTAAPAPN